MKISTKTGDMGETTLFGGKKVSKASPVIEVIGALDELQSFVGFCRFVVAMNDGNNICKILDRVQEDLYRMMSISAFGMKSQKNIEEISESDVLFLEKSMAKYEETVKDLEKFIRPGTGEAASRFHMARSICRRAERRFVEYRADLEVPDLFLKYLNRLSDLLFVLAYKFEA